MNHRRIRQPQGGRRLRAAVLATLMGGGVLSLGSAASAATGTLYVSTAAKATGAGTSCVTAKYSSINAAIAAAAPSDTVAVCNGTYAGQVTVTKPIVLSGDNATIIAAKADNGVLVPVSGATVQGFIVKGAIGEGILVVGKPGAPVSHVTIKDNIVEGNDQGNPTGAPLKTSSYAECKGTFSPPPAPPVPGDCGEGVHLMVAQDSTVSGNTVFDNAGGILLTDEFGPNDHNTIEDNTVEYNVLDCGITVASHSGKGYVHGATVPSAGGIYDNTIEHNTVIGNGVSGQGAGVLLATGVPGGAVYDNVVKDNTLRGNGLAGLTLHSHVPGEDLNGNVIEGNTIGTNNVDGDYDFAPHVDPVPTAVILATVGPVRVTVASNMLSDDTYGIWLAGPVTVTGESSNTFVHVNAHTAGG